MTELDNKIHEMKRELEILEKQKTENDNKELIKIIDSGITLYNHYDYDLLRIEDIFTEEYKDIKENGLIKISELLEFGLTIEKIKGE